MSFFAFRTAWARAGRFATVVLVLALALTGCGGGGDSGVVTVQPDNAGTDTNAPSTPCTGVVGLKVVIDPQPLSGAMQIRGWACNADPTLYKIALFAQTDIYYVQPLAAQPFTPIAADGSWSASTHAWDTVVAVLVQPAKYTPPATSLWHPSLDTGVEAWAEYPNTGPAAINFGGRLFAIKQSKQAQPGPNAWDNDPASVSVTADGLRLAIRQAGGQWRAAEAMSIESFPYGTFTVKVLGDLSQLDPNTVAAPLFLYARPGREFDFEFGTGLVGQGYDAQFAMQPWTTDGNVTRYQLPSSSSFTVQVEWRAGRVSFRVWTGWADAPDSQTIVQAWDYTGSDVPAEADAPHVHFNLWLKDGAAPANGQGDSITIKSFDFTTAPAPPVPAKAYTDAQIADVLAQLTMSDPTAATSSAPYKTVLSIGERAVPVLLATLKDVSKNTDSRKWCARLLGNVGSFDLAFSELLAVIHDTTGLYQGWHVAEAQNGLADLFERQTAAATVSYFDHPDKQVRYAAMQSFWFRPGYVRDQPTYDQLVRKMGTDADAFVRSAAAFALVDLVKPTDPIAPYVTALQDLYSADDAATALGNIGNSAAAPALIQCVAGSCPSSARANAVDALRQLKSLDAVPTLIAALQMDPDAYVRQAASSALGALGDKSAVPALITALAADTDSMVRSNAAEALGTLGDKSAVPSLITALGVDVDWLVRANAADALATLGDKSALPALDAARKGDPDSYVRFVADLDYKMLAGGS